MSIVTPCFSCSLTSRKHMTQCRKRLHDVITSDLQAIGVSAEEWYEVVQYRSMCVYKWCWSGCGSVSTVIMPSKQS